MLELFDGLEALRAMCEPKANYNVAAPVRNKIDSLLPIAREMKSELLATLDVISEKEKAAELNPPLVPPVDNVAPTGQA